MKQLHASMNNFLNCLDDRQQQLYAGLEASRRGAGGERLLSLILGWSEEAIAIARRELERASDPSSGSDGTPADAGKAKIAKAVPIGLPNAKTSACDRWQAYKKLRS